MAICLAGAPLVATQMASLADPCSGVVVLQVVDVPANPLALSIEDGTIVAAAVASVWLAAWALRAVRSVLSDRDS